MATTFKTASRVYSMGQRAHHDGTFSVYRCIFSWCGKSWEEVGRANDAVAAAILIEAHAREPVISITKR